MHHDTNAKTVSQDSSHHTNSDDASSSSESETDIEREVDDIMG